MPKGKFMLRVDQALLTAFTEANFGLPIAFENDHYDPVPGTPYAEVRVRQNDVTPANLKHSNATDGVFRVILRYPANTGAVAAKAKADEIFAVFKIGQSFSYDGLTLTVTKNQRAPGVAEDGVYKIVLTIPYRAFTHR